MFKKHVYSIIVILQIFACNTTNTINESEDPNTLQRIDGDRFYGGVFRLNEVDKPGSLHPLQLVDAPALRIASQVYEGLVKLNPTTLDIEPALAYKWIINKEATKYTFFIRKNVVFHPYQVDKQIKLNAYDVERCFKKLSTKSDKNNAFWLFENLIKGAKEYYNDTLNKESFGIKAINDSVLEVQLIKPNTSFLQILTQPGCWIYSEYFNEQNLPLGTGPYILKKHTDSESILIKNNYYWKKDKYGNNLPYINQIYTTFISDKIKELNMFKKGEIDVIYKLPLENIEEAVIDLENVIENDGDIHYFIQMTPAMITQYYGFNCSNDIFKDKRIRKAFNLAINREELVQYTLLGDAKPGKKGIIPPVFKSYNTENIIGHEFDVNKAKELMSEAGYPNGKNFPRITLLVNSGGKNNIIVAQHIVKMLEENIGIEINLKIIPFTLLNETVENGEAVFWRSGWAADYPDPENFLKIFTSHLYSNENNSFHFNNPVFDSLYLLGTQSTQEYEKIKYFQLAEQILIDESVFIPLYYEEITRLVNKRVKNLQINPMEFRDYSEVWLVK